MHWRLLARRAVILAIGWLLIVACSINTCVALLALVEGSLKGVAIGLLGLVIWPFISTATVVAARDHWGEPAIRRTPSHEHLVD